MIIKIYWKKKGIYVMNKNNKINILNIYKNVRTLVLTK